MAMGRPPVPNELKERRGTLKPSRLPVQVPVTVPAIGTMPPYPRGLKAPGKRVWIDIWTKTQGWITPVDSAMVEQAARLFDEIADLQRRLRKDGQILSEPIVSASGKVVGERLVPHPAAKLLRDAEKQWVQYLQLLAIPPTERARLGLTKVKAESKMEQLLRDRNKRDTKLGANPSAVVNTSSRSRHPAG